jgi:hypothetical protein
MKTQSLNVFSRVLTELKELDKESVEFDGIRMKPSQCYTLSLNPPHILFNTNCPDSLREKVLEIFRKYFKEMHEGGIFRNGPEADFF